MAIFEVYYNLTQKTVHMMMTTRNILKYNKWSNIHLHLKATEIKGQVNSFGISGLAPHCARKEEELTVKKTSHFFYSNSGLR